MSIRALVQNINSAAKADAVVDYIFNDHFSFENANQYMEKYFHQDVRTAVFSGGTISGRYLKLPPAAERLKSAFQKRHARSGGSRFTPIKAYHKTSSLQIAGLIAETGFKKFSSTICGDGVCFFTSSQKTEGYAVREVDDPNNPGNTAQTVVLEVTIFSRLAEKPTLPSGSDLVAFYNRAADIILVKNPLVIFPTAVYVPGQKLMNMETAGIHIQ